ncbi:tetratricopeptide repeat protein [Ferribacterium limneticum]|uniref:tetratricopeptide repeat protein n=1 Tax=Ferribacterium limneticum TaxID=76259 RepID=UPI001CFBF167|nr:tetratricopeptide repeat protein [Ferribacterium limneticum]UCV17318.1 tetratricopeptide repeat protein [Ferribacterium limneticum]
MSYLFLNSMKILKQMCFKFIFVCFIAVLAVSVAHATEGGFVWCPPIKHSYGPFDYRTATKDERDLVEGPHFHANVEALRKNTRSPNGHYIMVPGGEIGYTLRVFPNHPRALLALSRLGFLDKTDRPEGLGGSVLCYFQEAINFKPDDAMVRVIYGIHLTKLGKVEQALTQFDKAEELGEESPSLYYNLGLAYTDLKRYPEALKAAHKAYALGAQFPGLKDKLIRAGQWQDPVVK